MFGRVLRSTFPKNNLDALIPGAVGFFIILIYCRHSGIGVSPDSVTYISVARNLRAHGHFLDFHNRPLVIFPLFYPLFLYCVMLISGIDPLVFGGFINGLMFMAAIYLSGLLVEKFPNPSKWFKYLLLSCIVISPCLLEVYSMLWSESLFILLLLCYFVILARYLRSHNTYGLIFAALIAGMAAVTRYAGITLTATGAILILFDPSLKFVKKASRAVLFGVISIAPLLFNLDRNIHSTGTLTGVREKSVTTLNENIYYVGNVLSDWLPLPKDNYVLSYAVAVLAFAGCVLTLVYSIRHRSEFGSVENIFAVYFLMYAVFIVFSATISRYEQVSSRLFSASYIPFIGGVSYWLFIFIKRRQVRIRRIVLVCIGIAIFVVFQWYQLAADAENYDGIKDAGVPGYTEDPWAKDSEIINFIRANPGFFKKGCSLVSNGDDAVYFFTGLPCEAMPHKESSIEISNYYLRQSYYLIWMDDADNPELISLKQALSGTNLALLRQFNNGAIYGSKMAH